MITVGDQIFRLSQEVRKLKKQCQRYEAALRKIAAGNSHPKADVKPAALAEQALAEALAVNAGS